jgi:hypothetical protein
MKTKQIEGRTEFRRVHSTSLPFYKKLTERTPIRTSMSTCSNFPLRICSIGALDAFDVRDRSRFYDCRWNDVQMLMNWLIWTIQSVRVRLLKNMNSATVMRNINGNFASRSSHSLKSENNKDFLILKRKR